MARRKKGRKRKKVQARTKKAAKRKFRKFWKVKGGYRGKGRK